MPDAVKPEAPAPITDAVCRFLLSGRDARRRHGAAVLRVEDGNYVMEGPSGRHALAVAETDAARLDAHWRAFAGDERNAAPTLVMDWTDPVTGRDMVEQADAEHEAAEEADRIAARMFGGPRG